jgi:hypothetical protein
MVFYHTTQEVINTRGGGKVLWGDEIGVRSPQLTVWMTPPGRARSREARGIGCQLSAFGCRLRWNSLPEKKLEDRD